MKINKKTKKECFAQLDEMLSEEDKMVTPSLEAKIEKARQEYREGNTVVLKSHEDIDRYFDSL